MAVLFPVALSAQPGPKYEREALTVVIPGINDQASNEWISKAGMLAPSRERYVIQVDDGGGKVLEGKYLLPRAPSSVPADHVIRYSPNDPESVERLRKIAEKPNVTVVVDMLNLGMTAVSPIKKVWDEKTSWAAEAVSIVAQTHRGKYPESKALLFGHSAGTDVMRKFQDKEVLLKQIGQVKGELFNTSIAASARDPKHFANKKTVMIVADGDFLPSPGGQFDLKAVTGSADEAYAQEIAETGYTVMRIVRKDNERRSFFFSDRMEAHTATTITTGPNQTIVVYPSGSTKGVMFPSTSIANAVGQIATVTATDQRDTRRQMMDIEHMAESLRRAEPAPGIGGISVFASASMPFDPVEAANAGYDGVTGVIFIKLKDGRRISLPPLQGEVVRLGYTLVYVQRQKPELSIGSSRFVTPEGKEVTNLHPPGQQPVYYLGNTTNTLLGLVMFRCDEALGQMAFGTSRAVQPARSKIPEFRSMPELYPAKYADHPATEQYRGSDTRVIFNVASIEYAFAEGSKTSLVLKSFSPAVHFASDGPAEMHFAQCFQRNFSTLTETEIGRPFGMLVPFACSVAIFRWLKDNSIEFAADSVPNAATDTFVTPPSSSSSEPAKLESISLQAPTTLFGPSGPERIIGADGRETRIEYAEGRPVNVRRQDGALLKVIRDRLGVPLAIWTSIGRAAAFYVDPELGRVIADNVEIYQSEFTSIQLRKGTRVYPENQPEDVVALILQRFIHGDN